MGKETAKKIKAKKDIDEIIEEAKKEIEVKKEIEINQTISTGSTLLDLSLSGGRIKNGGVPGGIILEIFGPSGSGKSALLSEIAGSAQRNGGEARFDDPEARLDQEYSRIYGFEMDKKNYSRPDTVKEMFDGLWGWEPINKKAINVSCADSLAALSTEMEMSDEDKMGMKRAKDFSEGLRKTCRIIANNNWILACSNQERDGKGGSVTTPGGRAIPYYASLRIRITPVFPTSKIKKTKTINGTLIEKVIGIRSKCSITKSSIDVPYRECNVSIIFGYGIDDIRENLIFCRDFNSGKKYVTPDKKEFSFLDKAIEHIEENNQEESLKEQTIILWNDIQDSLKINRKDKKR